MKIGLIGNMNNNNFSLLRYFHAIGVDAELLLMTDDGVGPLSHFSPEKDTWDIDKWKPYINRISIANRFVAGIGNKFPWNILFWLKYVALRFCKSSCAAQAKPLNIEHISRELQPYTYLIGSGITPALLRQVGRSLNVFYPYSIGVEWLGDAYMDAALGSKNLLKRLAARAVFCEQKKGIHDARHVVISDIGYTLPAFEKIGVKPLVMQIPMIFKEGAPINYPTELSSILDSLDKFDIRFISHARHRWVNTGEWDNLTWDQKHSKHNDWIIAAYADFRRKCPDINSVLILAEYGSDYVKTKQLSRELAIENDIFWMPLMPRKYLLEVVAACDVGIGEFYSTPHMVCGGVGWEVMSCGKPLIHGFKFEEGEYEKMYGTPPPPICAANSPEKLTDWMIRLNENEDYRQQLGKKSLAWFDEYNGKGLARRWVKLIAES
jgi:glycosyltransferase involved in cell wall biosynthesis